MPNKSSNAIQTELLAELDENQRKAASAEFNAVVTAGAGSGKTKVLAARYAWLVMEKGYKVEEILTLTFTNKAVNEMYSRIFSLLAEHQDNSRAREAVREFHKAHIMTLDAFSAGIARTASTRFGISPDFASDNNGVQELAVNAALPFVLAHRDNPALQALIADRKIRIVAEELFAETVINYSPLSSPLNFDDFMQKQNEELRKQWKSKTKEVSSLLDVIFQEFRSLTKTGSVFYKNLKERLDAPMPETPNIASLLQVSNNNTSSKERQQYSVYFNWLRQLIFIRLNAPSECAVIVEILKTLRDIYAGINPIANIALQWDIMTGIFPLVDEFQHQFNRKKREAGLLTFNDIAHLAVDALREFPDIRKVYKDSFKSIMVDEFQDNNGLQRDLIFFLAENENRMEEGNPEPEDLSSSKMFFVGDEKQSIYRFRGADVSVFRGLAKTLSAASTGAGLSLINNYRSKPCLIDAFNRVFGGLDPSGSSARRGAVFFPEPAPMTAGSQAEIPPAGEELPGYEAVYRRVYAAEHWAAGPRKGGTALREDGKNEQEAQVHFCFLDESVLDKNDPQTLSKYELEAAYIAGQIRNMVDSGYKIPVRGKDGITRRPCTYQDFAVLQRAYTHQSELEKQCKNFGIPFTTDRPGGLFSEAPVNDLYMYLRLLVNPNDRIAYAAVIRSPFTRLSDETLAICMLNSNTAPFDESLEPLIPAKEQDFFREARERYRKLSEAARNLPTAGKSEFFDTWNSFTTTNLITRLWYEEGYRYETLWSASSQVYGGLFDLFFELARNIDQKGTSLPEFFDYLEGLINKEEKLDGIDLPPEEEGGIRITSIHKSKGLEFPVVFVYCSASRAVSARNDRTVYFSEKWGITVNLPKAEELFEDSGNYFFNFQKGEETAKEAAELRRLLYVAMTRAESRLFLTATIKGEGGKNPETMEDEYLKAQLARLKEKQQGKYGSFLDLLLPAIVTGDDESPPFTIETIPAYSREELYALGAKVRQSAASGSENKFFGNRKTNQARAAEEAAPLYAAADTFPAAAPFPVSIPASSLHVAEEFAGEAAGGPDAASGGSAEDGKIADSDIEGILENAGLEAADFGVLVHTFLEERLNGRQPRVPPKFHARLSGRRFNILQEKAEAMAGGFINSDLGRLCANAIWRETEFPILTVPDCEDGRTVISGQIDLLFEVAERNRSVIYVVDFKTDRIEAPDHHLAQLAIYERAASDIFGRPVRSWLFYLRSGRAVELSERTGKVSIERLVSERVK
ncbi:MAG: UvrD-helicase domain-containing protein [Treponema sp.]|jgi:ATP-dependent helicase/nuclease subunit A|nr:UvrD-helicase domain-containing protein [Treponema sp.]